MKRRSFIKALAAASFCAITPRKVFASDESGQSDLVAFSPDIATGIAERFAESMGFGSVTVADDNPIPLIDVDGTLKGYCVSYYCGSSPSGFLLLDIDCDGLISQYSFSDGVRSVYQRLVESTSITRNKAISSDSCLVYRDPLYYEVADFSSMTLESPTQSLPMPKAMQAGISTLQSGSDTWWNTFITYDAAFSDSYTFGNQNWVGDFRYVTEQEAWENIGKYACGPHACYCIGASWPNSGNTDFLISNPWADWSEYERIWTLTNTTIRSDNTGVTTDVDLASGFKSYCAGRGLSIGAERVYNPPFSRFITNVSAPSYSIVGAGITTSTGSSGHFMAVDGYAYLLRNSDKTSIPCLSVFNGWDDFVFLNYNFPRFNWKSGIFLSR